MDAFRLTAQGQPERVFLFPAIPLQLNRGIHDAESAVFWSVRKLYQ